MSLALSTIQVPRDRTLRQSLVEDSGVQRALALLRERSSGFGFTARRNLLSTSLRLTRSMAPYVADCLRDCRERIDFAGPVEIYVRPEPVFNAFCLKDPSGLIVIGLSSRLLESFTQQELFFVIGHELGHAAFDHFSIPMPHTAQMRDLAGPIVSRAAALQLFLWSRAAELSADRVGLLCARDAQAAASAFFKLASGISSDRIKPDLSEFAAQIDSLASAPEARAQPREFDESLDCFSTHPYSPVRVRALLAFARSRLYSPAGDLDETALNDLIERDLELMAPSYLEEKTAASELLRRTLYHAGVVVAAADHEIERGELHALRALLGADRVPDDAGRLDIEAITRDLTQQIVQITHEVAPEGRARLVQHLTIIATADGDLHEREFAAMSDIAQRLGVDPRLIEETIAGATRPLD